jgi:REP element-mobilizing transposase RayT
MARIARNVLPPSGIYHLTLRGVDGCDIHHDDLDRFRFLRFLKLATLKANWRLLAFCLMRNHFHLVVDGELESTSRGMHTLAFRHAQAFNTRHERRGHLFADRFYTRVVRDDEHLGAACAYVLQNAERVGIRDWPWRGGELANLG